MCFFVTMLGVFAWSSVPRVCQGFVNHMREACCLLKDLNDKRLIFRDIALFILRRLVDGVCERHVQ